MKTNLQQLRKAAGYKSAKEFAEAHSIPVATYTGHEQGARTLSLDVAWRYADIFDVSLDELAGRDFQPSEYADARQEQLNDAYGALDEPSKNAAVAAVQGMAAACARGEASESRSEDNRWSA